MTAEPGRLSDRRRARDGSRLGFGAACLALGAVFSASSSACTRETSSAGSSPALRRARPSQARCAACSTARRLWADGGRYLFCNGGAAIPGLISGGLSTSLPLAQIAVRYAALTVLAAAVVFLARPVHSHDSKETSS